MGLPEEWLNHWAECAQWRETEGDHVSGGYLLSLPKFSGCGVFTSEMSEAGEAVWRWSRCFESWAEELGLYIWVMAEGRVSREGRFGGPDVI